MKTTKLDPMRSSLLTLGLACFMCGSAAVAATTVQLHLHSPMLGAGTSAGPRGWASILYARDTGRTNQSLALSCRGLAANQLYHLMASWGTNGQLMHLSDFRPTRSGTILMQFSTGGPHRYAGTNYPGQPWGMRGAWTNHLSWVVFPGGGTNWCNLMSETESGTSPMALQGTRPEMMGGMGGDNGWVGGSDGMGGMDGMGWMGGGWPAMTNWLSVMSAWWSTMGDWCWDYTNLWNAGSGLDYYSTNMWGSLCQGAYHMMPLPAIIDPVPVMDGLVVLDENLQIVLAADLANPETFTYHVHCDLTPGVLPTARATLQASCTQRATHFALSANGLNPSTTYYIAINGGDLTPVVTDRQGRLQLRRMPDGVTSLRGMGSLSILDRNYNTVLSTSLPPK